MSQLEMISQPMHDAEWTLGCAHGGLHDSRTLLRHCVIDLVLPLVTVAAMSALVVATIVTVVTAVARAAIHL